MLLPSQGQLLTQAEAQELAVQVAGGGRGFVSPNPLVGCVIVDQEHRFLASGFHAVYGGPHAEVDAFSKLKPEQLKQSTVYVTLEPCSHHGKTPPCVDLFLDKGIRKVIVGQQDPNPLVAGQGLEKLRKNHISVEMNEEFSQKSARCAEIFLWHIQNKMPFVSLKVAITLDGKMAGDPGESLWITTEAARLRARELRAGYDATLIGAETFLKDNPWLDFRQTRWERKKEPKVVILDPRGRAADSFSRSRMSKVVKAENVFFIKTIDSKTLSFLYQKGLYSLYVEGGAKTHELFLKQKLFQKIYCFQSQKKLGRGLPWRDEETLDEIASSLSVELGKPQAVGEDLLFELYPHK